MYNRESLDNYDRRPADFSNYLKYNGRHFSKRLCDWAVSKMKAKSAISYITKMQIDDLLKKYKIVLENNILYDYVYVANMCRADYWGSSIKDDEHLIKYVKDVIDDFDAYDGHIFNRWYSDMCGKGIPIDWGEML